MVHKAVLAKELIENLNLKPGMTVVDGTLGAGGHSIEMLKKILPGGKLISIDWDEGAIQNFQQRLKKEGYDIRNRAFPAPVASNANDENASPLAFMPLFSGDKIVGYWCGVSENYANLDKIFEELDLNAADAILIDLGFSSDQIEDKRRGFSFLLDGPLDMRYSPETQKVTAADVVNKYSEKDLADIFWKYGEEKYARRIAREIARVRISAGRREKIGEVGKLVEIIFRSVPKNYKMGKIHPATRVFQALRIEVNQELENLKIFLEKAVNGLANGGRLAVISFHSLEDRIVKNFFRKEARDCVCPPKFPKCVCNHRRILKIITKKPIQPSEKEIRENSRARSAKMRVVEKM
ncbi:MAG: 16S rRNA methyltransferase [Candidatus Moranbacteria bacterium GW2011_GWC1_45_18]|nr:MAG: Ribosomal RNA small subunit methyltransferase H [Candidatus Moranbacteria bacterium GW2011_GWC2_40_12]KKT34001.1 MAG: Ribosomal RNA small subunit methyltransferase H [Candidatus Moranbacteria bacterium GW2011_GWF2_44_10]KKT71642.1 MAG: Ribosomal RNA small subunit methyltransferase H [Candidatus Moranbacteria bacterium GW2011_GWF1_44_4]KKT99333.1 MAG: 16S rRNA methyltransferase [Candidatus Moranbacteria bacterium GW2011_GWC1_45_18]OGI34688.1 MAG: 16S rRNA (cytosine(1402)-N(4))-methyltran